MEVKIKSNDEMIDATIEMINGVMVVSPIKFKPKDGDVVVQEDEYVKQIMICKSHICDDIINAYVFFDIHDSKFRLDNNDELYFSRYATEEEKKLLFDKLAEKGWEWDSERKELVRLIWKPKEGEEFWYPFNCRRTMFSAISAFYNKGRDMDLYNKDWCFKTEAECQEFCDKLNQAINQVKP